MKKMKLFPKIFLFTFTMMLLISIIAHLLIFLIAPSQNVLVTNMVVTNTGVSALSEVDMPRLITQTMLKTFPISIFCCATISALFSYFFSRGITTPILSLSKSANQMSKLKTDVRRDRVRSEKGKAAFDIHDRVNYAVTQHKLKVNVDKKTISLNLQIDTKICSMYEYFEIFLGRMMMCRGAADMLGATFKLMANGSKVL